MSARAASRCWPRWSLSTEAGVQLLPFKRARRHRARRPGDRRCAGCSRPAAGPRLDRPGAGRAGRPLGPRLGPAAGPAADPVRARPARPMAAGLRPAARSWGARAGCFRPLRAGQRLGIFAGAGRRQVHAARRCWRATRRRCAGARAARRARTRANASSRTISARAGRAAAFVVATSDMPAMLRRRAPIAAGRGRGLARAGPAGAVLMDSVTRFAMALREIGLAAGEPPATNGYPPSVFAELPRLLERAGPRRGGQHHRPVHGAGRGRRPDEPIARCGARHPRWPCRARPPRSASAGASRRSTCCAAVAHRARLLLPPRPRWRRARAARAACRDGGSGAARRLPAVPTRGWTRRSARPALEALLAQAIEEPSALADDFERLAAALGAHQPASVG